MSVPKVSTLDLRDRLMPRLPAAAPRENARSQPPTAQLEVPAFMIEDKESGRVVLTMPAETAAAITADDFLLHLSGRLVEAEKANGNGAFWSQDDIEFGLPSIAYGPLNWLHEERKIVGVLKDSRLVSREAAASDGLDLNTHVVTDSMIWRWLYPREAAMTAAYADARQLWYSMECISREVACQADACETVVGYLDAINRTKECCDHLRERSASRRFVQPIFQGAAIIVPPVKPGWAHADLSVREQVETLRSAASLVEEQKLEIPDLDTEATERMVAQVMAWARG